MRVMIATVMFVLGSGLASAQVLPTPGGSALGTTSPLGTSGQIVNAPLAPSGIGLGATQLNVGGLSPAPNSLNCATTATSGVSSAGTTLFDGGGMAGGTPGCSTLGAATAGASAGVVVPGAAPTSGSGIPLGATEIDNAGVSPLVAPPAPNFGVTLPPAP